MTHLQISPEIFQLLQDTILYGIGIAALRLFNLIITAFLTRLFTPAEYGVLDAILVASALLPSLMSLNLESALNRYYYDTPPGADRNRLISTILYGVLAISTIIGLAAFLTSPLISQLLFGGTGYSLILRLAITATWLQLNSLLFIWVLRLERRLVSFLICTGIFLIFNLALLYVFLGILSWGLEGFFIASLLANLAQGCLAFWLIRDSLGLSFSTSAFSRSLRFSLPIAPTVFITSLIAFSGRLLLLDWTNLTQVGLYGIASKISAFIVVLISPFELAWQQFAMSIIHHKDANQIYASVSRFVTLCLFILMSCFIIFSEEILVFVAGNEYIEASQILRILSPAIAIGEVIIFFSLALSVREKSIYMLISNLLALIVFLIVGAFLIRISGALGIAMAFLAGNVTRTSLVYLFGQRAAYIDFPSSQIFVAFLVAVMAALWLNRYPIPPAIKGLFIAGFMILLFILFLGRPVLTRWRA